MNIISYNVKIKFRTQETENFWRNLLEESLEAWNFCSKIVFDKYPNLKAKEIHDTCYPKLREKFSDMPSQVAIKVIQDVLAKYKSIKSNKHKIKKAPVKKNLSLQLDKRLYSNLTGSSINLTSEEKGKRHTVDFILYDKFTELQKSSIIGDPNMFIRNGEFFLTFPLKFEEKPLENKNILGIDLGCRRLVTTSDGYSIKGRELSQRKRNFRFNRRKLQSKKKNSHSARLKLKINSKKERNFTKNYLNLLSNKVLETDKGILVLEDLTKIKETTKKRKGSSHNSRMGQIPFYLFREILSYKALLLGKVVATVNPAYTSQIDSQTQKKEGLRKGCRFYTENNLVLDADWNAAINIASRYAKHPISCKLPKDGNLHFIGRLLSTSQSSDTCKSIRQADTL